MREMQTRRARSETSREGAMGTVARMMAEALGASGTPTEDQSWAEADAMHSLLMRRADNLMGCIQGSPEEEELRIIADALEAYEVKRWPEGKVAGGKG
jgi:hypothetical protein